MGFDEVKVRQGVDVSRAGLENGVASDEMLLLVVLSLDGNDGEDGGGEESRDLHLW